MIVLEGAGRRFTARGVQPVEALRDVTLRVPAGSVFAVVGPNGAGKTTLFALVLGFLKPTTGSVSVGGTGPRRWARTRGAAWLPERFNLPAGWRVRDSLAALARLEGLGPAEAGTAAAAVLDHLELEAHADKPVQTLSRGLLQRVGIAQALLAPRELVVLDEPTQGLDPLWRIRLREIVADLRAQGRTVLLASHELDEVERLADRAAVLRDGRLEEIVELRAGAAEGIVYRLELERPIDLIATAFPGAERVDGGADDGGGASTGRADGAVDGQRPGGAVYRVRVGDAADLTRRLAAVIESGGRIVSVQPGGSGLAARVRGGGAP
ncbi:MAG TPA: ABC transporter ATP-binding protein [Longimicrobiales bacterium]|nr:ABC transporter ATP-binding protein [Longimicrobiales bacterium]